MVVEADTLCAGGRVERLADQPGLVSLHARAGRLNVHVVT